MKNGPGRTQRAILAALRENVDGLIAVHLAEHVWGIQALGSLSHTRQETIRRALGNLERKGLADVFYVGSERTPGATQTHMAASITVAGFDLAGQLRRRESRA